MNVENSRELEQLRDDPEKVGLPALCWECGEDVETDNHAIIPRADGRPVCWEHAHLADELVTTELHTGYPDNNLGYDLEDSTTWREVVRSYDPNQLKQPQPAPK